MNTTKRQFAPFWGTALSLLLVSVLMAALPVWAQTDATPPENKIGVYNVQQSVEFGGRVVSNEGSQSIWSTFVDQKSGPRLLEESFDMHAPLHNGFLFDDLNLNTFGYGGDPNTAARLKILKGKYYTFQANFRRDKSFFDYDLLDNQLAPIGTPAAVGFTVSPHLSSLTRKMQDYNLNLFPVSKFTVRLGYSFADQSGDMFSSSHFGGDGQFDRPWRNTSNTYRAGLTYKLVKGTSFTFDHVQTHFKNDTSTYDANKLFTLPNGTPVDLGVTPCVPTATGIAVCNGFLSYNQFQPTRTDIPTDTFGFSSIYKNFDQTGHVFYSGGELMMPSYTEINDGLTTRTYQRQSNTNGTAWNKRVASGADYAATLRINDHLRIVETFRWDAYRIPTFYSLNQLNYFAKYYVDPNSKKQSANIMDPPVLFDPTKCTAPYTSAACPQHTSSSGADVLYQTYNNFEGNDTKSNIVSVEYDVNRRFGLHAGFKYEARNITLRAGDSEISTFYPGGPASAAVNKRNALCTGSVVNANGVCTITTSNAEGDAYEPASKGFVGGFWLRPVDAFRFSFDVEAMSTDHPWLVIAPKTFQFYRFKSSYRPKDWMSVAVGANFLEKSNDQEYIDNKQHNRSVNFDATFAPNKRVGLDLSYAYSDIFSNSFICLVDNPNFIGASACPVASAVSAGVPLSTLSFYQNNSHFGSFGLQFQPASRVHASVGYTLTRTDGNSLLTYSQMTLGPLDSWYHMPSASVAFDLNKQLTFKTAWNYYGYEENTWSGPTAPRDARGHVVTLSLKYKIGGVE